MSELPLEMEKVFMCFVHFYIFIAILTFVLKWNTQICSEVQKYGA